MTLIVFECPSPKELNGMHLKVTCFVLVLANVRKVPLLSSSKLSCSLYNRYLAGGFASALHKRAKGSFKVTVLLVKLVEKTVLMGR